ncbi:MAG: signal peptidase I [Gemmatimonadetes bacterium]|nr:signal peptidase I [Gemmatimonadota bacterium]
MGKTRRRQSHPEHSRKSSDTHNISSENPRNVIKEWSQSLVVAGILFLFIRSFVLQTFVITSGSMEETLLVGDFLVANRAAVGTRIPGTEIRIPGYSSIRRGDVLVFDPTHEPDLKLVKRLIGMPGDTLSMRESVLTINGETQFEEYVRNLDPDSDEYHPWMVWQLDHLANSTERMSYSPTRDNWGPLVIPPNHYFMLGDNRHSSLDSRYWGLLERWRFEGRAAVLYFSYNRDSFRPFPWIREIRWERTFSLVQ